MLIVPYGINEVVIARKGRAGVAGRPTPTRATSGMPISNYRARGELCAVADPPVTQHPPADAYQGFMIGLCSDYRMHSGASRI